MELPWHVGFWMGCFCGDVISWFWVTDIGIYGLVVVWCRSFRMVNEGFIGLCMWIYGFVLTCFFSPNNFVLLRLSKNNYTFFISILKFSKKWVKKEKCYVNSIFTTLWTTNHIWQVDIGSNLNPQLKLLFCLP